MTLSISYATRTGPSIPKQGGSQNLPKAVFSGRSCASPEICYVFGGRHANSYIPASIYFLVMYFRLDPSGTFPVYGMRLHLVKAAGPAHFRTPIMDYHPSPQVQQYPQYADSSLLQVDSDDASDNMESEEFCP